jgi:hypothetical protein
MWLYSASSFRLPVVSGVAEEARPGEDRSWRPWPESSRWPRTSRATLADLDALTSMLIGSFYGRYVTLAGIPDDWPARVLSAVWPPDTSSL